MAFARRGPLKSDALNKTDNQPPVQLPTSVRPSPPHGAERKIEKPARTSVEYRITID
jgi:hypothetical protein